MASTTGIAKRMLSSRKSKDKATGSSAPFTERTRLTKDRTADKTRNEEFPSNESPVINSDSDPTTALAGKLGGKEAEIVALLSKAKKENGVNPYKWYQFIKANKENLSRDALILAAKYALSPAAAKVVEEILNNLDKAKKAGIALITINVIFILFIILNLLTIFNLFTYYSQNTSELTGLLKDNIDLITSNEDCKETFNMFAAETVEIVSETGQRVLRYYISLYTKPIDFILGTDISDGADKYIEAFNQLIDYESPKFNWAVALICVREALGVSACNRLPPDKICIYTYTKN